MVLEFFRGRGDEEIVSIEAKLGQMLGDCRHTFGLAITALLAGTDPAAVRAEIRSTDRRVNETERIVRRELIVNVSVHGVAADIPLILMYMSIVKDIERIGDYAKNIFDMAFQGADLSADSDIDVLRAFRDRTTDLIVETGRAFAERDVDQATEIIERGDTYLREYDSIVHDALTSDEPASGTVSRALLARYLKRITAHLLNVLSAVVMPVDQLDYYDEAPEDRR